MRGLHNHQPVNPCNSTHRKAVIFFKLCVLQVWWCVPTSLIPWSTHLIVRTQDWFSQTLQEQWNPFACNMPITTPRGHWKSWYVILPDAFSRLIWWTSRPQTTRMSPSKIYLTLHSMFEIEIKHTSDQGFPCTPLRSASIGWPWQFSARQIDQNDWTNEAEINFLRN